MSNDFSKTVAKQRKFFASGQTLSLAKRAEWLRSLEENFVARREELLAVLEADLGKPEVEAFLAEYYFVLQEVRLVRKNLKKWLRPRWASTPLYFQPAFSTIHRDPFGVVLVVAPWNYPIQLALSPLIAAVAAGNTVVLKPSELAPRAEEFLRVLIAESFPEEVVSVVTGDAEVSASLLEEKFDFIFFTGSTRVGKVVAEKAARNLTPCVLELGGKCPVVVDLSVEKEEDLRAAAKRILTGKFFNGGQTCIAPDYLLAHRRIVEPLTRALIEVLEEFPWEEEMARMIHRGHYDRLLGLVETVPESQVVAKGEDDAERLHLAPRLLRGISASDAVMREELFGPILPIVSYEGEDELLRIMGAHPEPLTLYVFSKVPANVRRLCAKVRSGSVCVNDTFKQASNLALPFGGVGQSGQGRYRGRFGVEAFTQLRPITRRFLTKKDPFESLPPREGALAFFKKWLS